MKFFVGFGLPITPKVTLLFLLLPGFQPWPPPAALGSESASSNLEAATTSAGEDCTDLFRIEESAPENMVRLAEDMIGPAGRFEYDPESRVVVLTGDCSKVDESKRFLQDLMSVYRESSRQQILEQQSVSREWTRNAKYLGKLQPGESVRIDAVLLLVPSDPKDFSRRTEPDPRTSRKAALEEVVLELDSRRKAILAEKGFDSPELTEVKSQLSAVLALLDKTDPEVRLLIQKLIDLRDLKTERLQRVDPDSAEFSLLRAEIARMNVLAEKAEESPTDQVLSDIMTTLRRESTEWETPLPDQGSPSGTTPVTLPEEAERLGIKAEDLGIFARPGVATLGVASLRATVFGDDSNGIAFTTLSDYSMEFRLGHSTLGVTVASIPERKVHDQNRGIQGVVTRLNKILLDTETTMELDRPILVGSYTHADGSNLLTVVRLTK